MHYRVFILLLFVAIFSTAKAQLDRIHWLPPVMTDTTGVSASNARDHYVVISTPSTSPVPYTIKGGDGSIIQSGTVSNSAPINFQIAQNVSSNIVPTIAGRSDHHVGIEELNTVTTEGIVIEADAPVFVNVRQRSRSQGASLTSKGCAALGTEFRVGTMRNTLGASQSFRNDFFSIMATEDNTVVTVDQIKPGMIFAGRTDTSPITVTLQKWESYTIAVNHPTYTGTADVNDIDGTRVTSTKAVTLVSGSYLGSPASAGSRDAGFDQPGPVARAGTEYVLLQGAGSVASTLESPQIIATKPNTNIFLNGSLTPFNATPLQPGDYLYLNGNFAANGTMYVESNEPVIMHQTTAGSNSAATSGFSYIPPLSFDIDGVVDNIAQINQIGTATLRVVTTTGSSVSVNGGPPLNGALAVAGTSDWVAYFVPNITGNVKVESTGPLAASVLNLNNPVGAAGYFSGFPEFSALIEITSTADCLPGLELQAVDPSGALIQRFEWFNGDGTPTGVTGPDFTPTVPGDYFVRSFLTADAPCEVEDSAIFTVKNCPVSDVRIEKSVPQVPVGNGDVVTFSIVVTNDGPDPAANVGIEDIVPSGYTYVGNSIVGGDVNSDASPSGTGLRWLINSLAANASATVTFEAQVQPAGVTLNEVNVTSDSIDNDLTNNTDSADIIRAVPAIDVTKSLDSLTDNLDGTFTAAFTVTVVNNGNEPIANLQIKDALTVSPNDFPAGTVGAVTGGNLTAGTYNGTSDSNLLAGTDTIPVSESRTVTLTVTFTPDNTAPYQNQAAASGEGASSGTPISAPSDDPTTAAVDDPTVVTPVLSPDISLVKNFQSTAYNNDGTFTSTFSVTIENTGNEVLTGLALVEDVSNFPAGSFTNTPVPATLAVGQSEVITVEVTYTPNSVGPYTNKAAINATGTLSNQPATATDTAPVTPPFNPSVAIVKTLTSLVDNGGGQFSATFDIVTTNDGSEPLSNVTVTDDLSGFPAGATLTGTLSSTITLAVGASVTDTVTVDFTLDANAPYSNTAEVAGLGTFTTFSVDDQSKIPVEPTILPALEVVKTLGTTTDNSDGSFSTTFTITTTNTGNEPLNNVTVTDDLSGFPSGATIAGPLSTSVALAIGASVTDTVTVTFTPNGAGPFNNIASATGIGDFSTDSAADDSPAVPVTPPLDAAVAVNKELASLVDNNDGTFTATFTLTAENTGNEPLQNLQITDSLADFPTGTIVTSSGNPAFNGLANTNTLATPASVAVGATEVVTITATFTPDGSQPYTNTAQVSATGAFTNSPETGTSPEVIVEPILTPTLSLAKTLGLTTVNPDGTVFVVFDIVATNNGNEALETLQITDALSNFPGATGTIVTSTDLAASYNAATGTLLAGTDTLAINESKTVSIEFTFQPDSAGPFENQATATSSGVASDDPAAAASPIVPVTPVFTPELFLTKTLQTVDHLGGGIFEATYQLFARNDGNEPLTNVTLTDDITDFPAGTTITGTLASGATLAVGESLVNLVTITFPGDANSPYTNTANATSTGEYSTDPAPATDSIDIIPPFDAQIEITKDVRAVTIAARDIVTSQIDITVVNVGNEPLDDISIIDDLAAAPNTFPAASNATATILNPDATTNASYTGQQPNIEMLAPGQSLAVGDSKTITIVLTYTAVPGQSEYLNQATAMATGAFGGGQDTEISDNPDTPGIDNDPSGNAPPFEPELDIFKTLSSVSTAADGEVTATFLLTIDNVGTETVEGLQVVEDLTGFPAGATFTATSTDFTIAIAGNDLLDGTDDLVINSSGTIEVIVTFQPDGPGPFVNEASMSGTGLITRDPDFDTSGPVEVIPTFTPTVALTKTLDTIVDNFTGTFTSTFTITAENTGDEPLENLQITDLLDNFPANRTFTATTTDFTLGTAGSTDLLAGTDTLAIGASGSLTLTVTFAPADGSAILNTATATADGTFSGNPTTDDDQASSTPPFLPGVELSKTLVSVIDNGDGTFTSTFTIAAFNTGNEDLINFQITDTFSNFPAGSVTAVTSTDFTVAANIGALLDGTDTLLYGGNGSLTAKVTFTPTSSAPIENQASASGEGVYTTTTTTEPSDDPTTEDPDDPALLDDDPTTSTFELLPSFATSKSLVSNSFIGNGQFQAVFNIYVENTGNEALTNLTITEDLSGFPAGATVDASALPTAAAPATLAVGADVTYQVTVTYVPDSALAYQNVANVSAAGSASGDPLTDAPAADVQPVLEPSSTLNKVLVGTTDLGSGNFQSTFQLVLSNTGNETLANLQISESLAGFPAGATAVASSTDFNIAANTGPLLVPGQTLADGTSGTVTYIVDFTADGNAPYTNQATSTSTGAASANPGDSSSEIVPVPVPFAPAFTLAKALTSITDVGDGSFIANYTIVATNTGNEPLASFQINEPLTNFPAGSTLTATSTSFTPAASFTTGNLLAGNDILAIGATQSVSVSVTFTPTSGATIENTVSGTAVGESSGDPATTTSNTPSAQPDFTPAITVTKTLDSSSVDPVTGDISATYSIEVTNSGTQPIKDLQIVDDLTQAGGFPATVIASATVSPNLTAGTWNGVTLTNLLAGSDTLAVGEIGTIMISLTSPAVGGQTEYLNQAVGNAVGDFDDDPTPPTPSDDPTTGDPNDPTALNPAFFLALDLQKDLVSVVDQLDGSFIATFDLTVTNTSNEDVKDLAIVDDLSGFPATATSDLSALPTAASFTIGQSETYQITVTFVPESGAQILNKAFATATGVVSDTEMTSTMTNEPVIPPLTSTMTLDKQAVGIVDNADGTFTATFALTATNTSNQTLENVQITDDLSAFAPLSVTLVSADLSTVYDATTGTLLDLSDTLAIGESKSLDVIIDFIPQSSDPVANTATADAIGATDGEPGTAVSPAAEVTPILNPALTVAKTRAGPVQDLGGGNFRASFLLEVTNIGNEELLNLQVTDTLSDFPGGRTFTATSSDFVIASDISSGDLLLGTETLPVGANGTITVIVEFAADANQPYDNTATGEGRGKASGVKITDASETITTDPPFAQNIVLTKTFDRVIDQGDGTFIADFSIDFQNLSNEPLDFALNDALGTFPAGSTAAIIGSTGVLVNAPYNGTSDIALLAPNTQLAIGAAGQVRIAVTYTPDAATDYANQVDAVATGTYSLTPASESATAPVVTPLNAIIALEKTLLSDLDNSDGTFTSTFQLTTTNNGNQPLSALQITEDLSDFNAASVALTSTELTPAYDPVNFTLLDGSDSLAVGETRSIEIAITYTPDGTGPFENRATIDAEGSFDAQDTSDSSAAPVTPLLAPSVDLKKTFTGIVDEGDGTFTASFDIEVTNDGNEPLTNLTITDNVSDFPAGSVTDFTTLPSAIALAVGDSETYSVTVRFTPDGPDAYENSATVTAAGEFSTNPVTDSDTSEAEPPLAPSSSLNKALVDIVDNGDGSFDANYLLTLENTGNEILTNVQVSDDISTSFPAGSTLQITATSANLTESIAGANLLAGNDALAVNSSGTINLTVTFIPDGPDPYLNTASLTAVGGASGDPGNSTSDDPLNPDGGPTTTTPVLEPEIDLTKTLDSIVSNPDGSFVATFILRAENTGNEILDTVQIFEDLSDFPASATLAITASDQVTPAYDVATGALLAGTDALPVNAVATVTIEVTFVPERGGAITNTATIEATGNASGDAVDDSDTADVTPPFDPQIEISKDVKTVNVATDGSGQITSVICLIVRNVGNEPMVGVQVSDALNAAPNNFQDVVTATVASTDFAIGTYDGTTNVDMLAGTDTLAVGEAGIIELTLVYRESTGQMTYLNQATATGAGEFSGNPDSEVSDNPDTPGADNDPTNNAPPFEPELEITKALDGIVDNGSGSFTATFTLEVNSVGTETVNNVQITEDLSGFPAGATAVATSSDFNIVSNTGALLDGFASLTVGSSGTLTYAVTFDADGTQPYTNQAVVSGVGNSTGDPDSDISDDPATADPEDPTEVDPTFIPTLVFAKELTNLADNADGTFTATYTLAVSNPGNEPIANLQISDPLTNFPAGSLGELVSTTFTPNATAYDGVTQPNLLAGTDTVPINGTGEVVLNVTFTPVSSDPVGNTATISGLGDFGGDPFTTTDGTEVQPVLTPSIDLTKEFVSITDQSDGTFLATFNITVMNNGNEALGNVIITDDFSDFPAGATTDISELATVSTLGVGASETVAVTVLFTPDRAGAFTNSATVNADGVASTTPVTDSDTAPATPALMPDFVVTKALDGIVDQGDGSFIATFTIAAQNTGNEAINNFTIVDDTSDFPSGSIVSGTLPSGVILPVGGSISETVTVTFTPDGDQPYTNEVTATGASSAGNTPISKSDTAETEPILTPALEITKTATGITSNGDGTFLASFTITVQNTGNEILNNVTATDPLVGFPAGAILGGDPLPVNATFTVDELEDYSVSVLFTPDSAGPFTNVAEVNGTGGASGDPAMDDSGTPTESTPSFTPSLAFSKTAGTLVDEGDGTFTAQFDLVLENTGDEPLVNVQITDSLAAFAQVTDIVITPTATVANPDFDGDSDTNLLSAGTTLAVAQIEEVSLTFTFTPDGTGPFGNTASGTGSGQFGGGPVDTPDTAEVTPLLDPQVEISKDVKMVSVDGAGIVTSTIEMLVRNVGNEPVINVQVSDDLQLAPNNFPASTTASVISTDFTVAAYDGITQVNMLDGSDTLAPGEAGIITLTIVYNPADAPVGQASFVNQAIASVEGEFSGAPDSELSDNPDTPATANDPSDSAPPFEGELEITKELTGITDIGGGQFRADFEIIVLNTGNEGMREIIVTDDISTTFPAGSIASANSTDFTTFPPYDGSAAQAIIVTGGTLPVGLTATVNVSVTFTPDTNGPYLNTASVEGEGSQSGQPDFDLSDDPTTADPEDPTVVDPVFTSGIEIRKSLVGPVVDETDGTFTATFLIEVENTSNQPLKNVQITDDLSQFGTQQTVTLTSTGLTTSYNAVTGTLLSGLDTLAFGETKSVQVVVLFTPETGLAYQNTAEAGAVGALDDTPVTDDSGLPVDAPPALAPSLDLQKTLTSVDDLGGGQFQANFTFTLLNNGNEAMENVVISDGLADFPNGSVLTVANGESLTIGLLGVGEMVTRSIEVTFTADAAAPYENQATVNGTSVAGETPIEVISDDPVTPEPNDPTETAPPFAPAFTLVKTTNGITDLGDGRFTSSYDIALENTGNEPLQNLEVLDDLSDFPLGATAELIAASGISANLTYDGSNPVIESGALAIGASAVVTIQVTFTPDDGDPILNDAFGTAEGVFGGGPTDGDNPTPAPVTPDLKRSVIFDKALVGISELGGGVFRADFTLFIMNTGNEPLAGLAITDPLIGFPAGSTLGGDALPTSLNLAIGADATYNITVTFTPNSDLTYSNQAVVNGTGGTSGVPFTGVSNDPDSFAPDDPTRAKPVLTQGIMVAKSLQSSEALGDDLFRATYQITASNTGNQPLNKVQIVDDLSDFGAASVVLSSTELSTSFNPATGELLNGTDTLAIGQSKSLTIAVTFTRTRNGAYLNSATADAEGAFTDVPVTDGTDVPVPFTPENQKPQTYDEFLTENGLSGDNDDQDIYGTIFEYATCLDPTSGENKKAFCLQYNPATGAFDASFLRRTGGLSDVTYTLEGLDDLDASPAGWAALNLTASIAPAGVAGLDAEKVTYANIPTKFVRLTVEVGGVQQRSQVFGQSTRSLDPECQTYSDPFLAKECFSGTILSQNGLSLELSSDMPALAGNLYLEMLGGTYEGHRFEIDEAASLGTDLVLTAGDPLNTLDPIPTDLDGLVAVRVHRTLKDLAPPQFFQADADPTVGNDETRALIYRDGALQTYFVNATTPPTWSEIGDSTGADAGDLVIDPCHGIFLHSLSGPVSFPTAGVVREWDVACPLEVGYNLVGAVYPLDESPNDRDMLNGFTGTLNPGTADQLHYWLGDQGTGNEGYESHFYAKTGAFDQWVIQANSDLSSENDDLLFPMNRAVFYDKIQPQLWIRPLPWTP